MNALIRLAVVVALALPLALFCLFGLGRFVCDPEELRSFLREVHRDEELQQVLQATLRRVETRGQVVREVIAQRCSLSEALARFQELDCEGPASFPKLSEILARQYPSEAERHYRLIITIVKSLLEDRPEEAAAVLRRLEKDYQQLQADIQMSLSAPGGADRVDSLPKSP